MKATQLIEVLQQLVAIHGDLPLCYGVDNEGNAFAPVLFEAIEGTLDGYEFTEHTDKPTHICVN